MKANRILLILLFTLSACGDLTYRYYTRINADGTVFKRIIAEGDSSGVYKQPFSFDVNDGWLVKYDKKIDGEKGDTLFLAIAEKTFDSVEAVNNSLYLTRDSAFKDNIKVELKSRFAWFFTFYEYTETYLQRFPYQHVSIDDYLTEEEYAYSFLGDTSCMQLLTKEEAAIFDEQGEEKYWKFLSVSMGIEFVNLLNTYASKNEIETLSDADSLFVMQLFESSIDNGPKPEQFCTLLDERLNTSWVSQAYCNEYFANFERQIDDEVILLNDADYFAQVEVPGLAFETNATSIINNTAMWQFKRGGFSYKDYVLHVRYRTINYWAFVVVGVLVVILVLSFVLKRKI